MEKLKKKVCFKHQTFEFNWSPILLYFRFISHYFHHHFEKLS